MKILITGAGGFVGKRLVRKLADDGHQVFAMVRADPAEKDGDYFLGPRVTMLRADLGALDCQALPAGLDAVYTLGQSSYFRDFPARAEEIYAVNVTANLKLLQWARQSGVRRFVHASSGGIYGGRLGAQFRETDLLAVDSPLGFYLGTKLCSEVNFQNFRQFFETAVTLRPFFIYGSGQRRDMFIARLVDSVRHGTPISLQGSDGLRVNPIYVDDAVAAFAAALELRGCHVVNVAGPDTLTLRQVSEAIGRMLGKAPVFETRPGEPVDYVADIEFARRELALNPRSFADGMRQTIGAD